jgi:hypothetical protein
LYSTKDCQREKPNEARKEKENEEIGEERPREKTRVYVLTHEEARRNPRHGDRYIYGQ